MGGVLAMALLWVGSAGADGPVSADILIRGGLLYDGGGGEPVAGDVAIRKDRIVAVGRFTVAGTPQIVEAAGCCVAPGFIDLHNHSDRSITAPATRANLNFLRQGCTTIVTGNCGGGVVDVAEYFQTLERQGAGTHVIHLVPQGSVRRKVMGEVDRPPTPDELRQMQELVEKGMQEGAFGMSTGLIYVPGAYSTTAELVELARVAARYGGIYASHIRTEGPEVLGAIAEALSIGQQAGCPVHVSHLKASGPAAWGLGNDLCSTIEAARRAGQKVTADQYPYTASSTSLVANLVPTWAQEGGSDKLRARMDDPATAERIREAIRQQLASRGGPATILLASFDGEPGWVGRTLLEIAQEQKRDANEIAWDILRAGGASAIFFNMSEEDVRLIAARDFVATASDGSARAPGPDNPHPRSYGTFPRKIGECAHRQGWLPVAQAIRSATGLPADILGLEDRGYLRPGAVADLVVFELDSLRDEATYKDPHRYATGLRRVYVAGQVAVIDDRPQDVLAGRPIRRARLGPAGEQRTRLGPPAERSGR